MIQWFVKELCPFSLKINKKFKVSVHYVPYSCTHSTQTWHIDTSMGCAGQVRIWSWLNDFGKKSNFHIQLILTEKYILRISRSSLNLAVVQWIGQNYLSWMFWNFQFQHSYFCGNVHVFSHYLGNKYAIWKKVCALNFV
jgi:hypothetical protein